VVRILHSAGAADNRLSSGEMVAAGREGFSSGDRSQSTRAVANRVLESGDESNLVTIRNPVAVHANTFSQPTAALGRTPPSESLPVAVIPRELVLA
jgi:hypothetical protein